MKFAYFKSVEVYRNTLKQHMDYDKFFVSISNKRFCHQNY